MLLNLYLILLLVSYTSSNFIFDINFNSTAVSDEIFYTLENTFENTLEPTLEPTVHTIIIPSSMPSYVPSSAITETIGKVLEFNVEINLTNYTNDKLDNNDENIILYSFQELTEISKEYLTIKANDINVKRLILSILNNDFYSLLVTIIISVPLIGKYKIYESNPIELYNSFNTLITQSIVSGVFQDTIKEYAIIYNSTSFYNIDIDLIGISNANIIDLSYSNDNDKKFSTLELSLIIIFTILGVIIFSTIIYKKFFDIKKVHTQKNDIENLMINDTTDEPLIVDLKEPRLVEILKNECKL